MASDSSQLDINETTTRLVNMLPNRYLSTTILLKEKITSAVSESTVRLVLAMGLRITLTHHMRSNWAPIIIQIPLVFVKIIRDVGYLPHVRFQKDKISHLIFLSLYLLFFCTFDLYMYICVKFELIDNYPISIEFKLFAIP